MTGWSMLVIMSLYNLWLVYLRLNHKHSWVFIGLLALASIILSYWLLDHKHWLYLTLSLSLLPALMLISKSGLASGGRISYEGLYFIFLVLFYVYIAWQARGILPALSPGQWKIAGLGLLIILCLFNFGETLFRVPQGLPASAIQTGLVVRQLFEKEALTSDDKILIEVVEGKTYKGIQVMSNYPGNFILDRVPFSILAPSHRAIDTTSFLLDKNSSPYEVGNPFVMDDPAPWYETPVNPFSLTPPMSLDEYLTDKRVRLVIIKSAKLEALLTQQTGFRKINQVADYLFYYAAK
jgi:hypothetical protein